jgi:hypothetical protein
VHAVRRGGSGLSIYTSSGGGGGGVHIMSADAGCCMIQSVRIARTDTPSIEGVGGVLWWCVENLEGVGGAVVCRALVLSTDTACAGACSAAQPTSARVMGYTWILRVGLKLY